MSKYYITTAIDYANASPHLGHALEKIGADCIALWRRLVGIQARLGFRFSRRIDHNGPRRILGTGGGSGDDSPADIGSEVFAPRRGHDDEAKGG
jgi:hypothetical protein